MKLSDRLRPDVEAAPWVIAEVKQLEQELEAKDVKSSEFRIEVIAAVAYQWEQIEILQARVKELEKELADAYLEMRKQLPSVVFDREVWVRARHAARLEVEK